MKASCVEKKQWLKWGLFGGGLLAVLFDLLLLPLPKVKWIVASGIVTFIPYLFIKSPRPGSPSGTASCNRH